MAAEGVLFEKAIIAELFAKHIGSARTGASKIDAETPIVKAMPTICSNYLNILRNPPNLEPKNDAASHLLNFSFWILGYLPEDLTTKK